MSVGFLVTSWTGCQAPKATGFIALKRSSSSRPWGAYWASCTGIKISGPLGDMKYFLITFCSSTAWGFCCCCCCSQSLFGSFALFFPLFFFFLSVTGSKAILIYAAFHEGLAMALFGDWLLVVKAGTERVPASLSMASSTSCWNTLKSPPLRHFSIMALQRGASLKCLKGGWTGSFTASPPALPDHVLHQCPCCSVRFVPRTLIPKAQFS